MFSTILIANRGEIACRAMRTARALGIRTVAVFSEADREALHVAMADEAVCIGTAPASESYLRIDAIVDACRQTGAEAVYPGYGFLSENAEFARRLQRENIAFIGPDAHAIEVMGDKITSKRLAEQVGVNTIPGYTDVIADAAQAVAIARDIGYPVMLKASAGGGGKGMRVARDDDECRDGFERATSEARSSFGDERVFLEKFIDEPRHIEIQVIADTHGNTLYLNERECSIQRRHQKVIEEAPSPFIDAATRDAMGKQAVALAEAVQYCSAGTVEFIVDAERNFYFLEMNTRLQVEHPVTEFITGLDLVELMIRVADGEALPLTQSDVGIDGWAVETRVYAENPLRGFLPSTGRLTRYRPPAQNASVRVDAGVYEGGEVSLYYDPMIAKLVTWGSDRDQAISAMSAALGDYLIEGVSSNIPFLAALMQHPRFLAGTITTNFIDEEYPQGFSVKDVPGYPQELMAVAAAAIHYRTREHETSISGQLDGYEADPETELVVVDGEVHTACRVARQGTDVEVITDDVRHRVSSEWQPGEPLFAATVDTTPVLLTVLRHGTGYTLARYGIPREIRVMTPRAAELAQHMLTKSPPDMSRFLLSPMPGLLVGYSAAPGQTVKAGEELAVIEAMKMENSLRAERDGVISALLCEPGATLEVDQPIIEFE